MEDRPAAAGRRDEVLHPEPLQDACLAARPAFGPDSPGRAASVDAMMEISARLAAGLQAVARLELQSQQALTEPRLPDAGPQERPAVREFREESGSAWRREPLDAAAHRVSGQQLAERQAVPRPEAPQAHLPEHQQGAAEERRRDARRQERQPAEQPRFRRQALQPVSEPQQESQLKQKQAWAPMQAQPVSAAEQQPGPPGARAVSRQSSRLPRRLRRQRDPGSACAQVPRAPRRSSSSASFSQ